ncbi:MAG: hypothetical protein ACI9PY_003343, partial [Ascidiaceihabitans sp.]
MFSTIKKKLTQNKNINRTNPNQQSNAHAERDQHADEKATGFARLHSQTGTA